MANRSLNKVTLIGNLTRDPELRYTPNGTAVCSFGVATNRSWTTDTGEKREETEFHRIVAWNKLAELCSQLCTKGRKIFVEGRLSTRSWTTADGQQRTVTEIVIEDMILLDSKKVATEGVENQGRVEDLATQESDDTQDIQKKEKRGEEDKKTDKSVEDDDATDEVNPDDIPF